MEMQAKSLLFVSNKTHAHLFETDSDDLMGVAKLIASGVNECGKSIAKFLDVVARSGKFRIKDDWDNTAAFAYLVDFNNPDFQRVMFAPGNPHLPCSKWEGEDYDAKQFAKTISLSGVDAVFKERAAKIVASMEAKRQKALAAADKANKAMVQKLVKGKRAVVGDHPLAKDMVAKAAALLSPKPAPAGKPAPKPKPKDKGKGKGGKGKVDTKTKPHQPKVAPPANRPPAPATQQ